MTGGLPDDGTDPRGFLLSMADRVEADALPLDESPRLRAFALAQAALWRGIEIRHRMAPPRGPDDDQPMCTWCGDEVCWPCPDLADAVAAARVYLDGAAG